MKKLILPLLVLGLFTVGAVSAFVAKPTTYTFTVMDTEGGKSNASGEVTLKSLPNGKTMIQIHAKGLQPGGQYFLTWSTASSCALETDNASKTFEHLTVKTNGNLNHVERVDGDVSAIGSIGIRTETGQVLVACASTTN